MSRVVIVGWGHAQLANSGSEGATFDRLSQAEGSLVDFMRRSPMYGMDDLQFDRYKSSARELELSAISSTPASSQL